MKHLREYNESNLSDTVSDICLDLNDEGFTTSISEVENRPHISELRIEIKSTPPHHDKGFRPYKISDTLSRIYSVIGDSLLNSSVRLYAHSFSYYEVESKSVPMEHCFVYGVEIRFYKNVSDRTYNNMK